MNDTFQFKLSGPNLTPHEVRAGDIANLLTAIEDALYNAVAAEHPQLTKDSLLISFIGIDQGSVDLNFASVLPELVNPAMLSISTAVRNNDIASLPVTVQKPIRDITQFIKIRDGQMDLLILNGKPEYLASITPDLELPKASFISGDTVIYGEIVRVGGVEPKVEIKTIGGKTHFCPFDRALASQLGSFLYQTVGLKGPARWDTKTLELVDFRVTEITEYQHSSIVEAFAELKVTAGKYFEDVEDVVEFVSGLRKG